MPELRVTYSPDDEWTGELKAVVECSGFSGQGSAWFAPGRLKQDIIPAFRMFPISDSQPPKIEGGFWDKGRRGELEQYHLRIAVRKYNSRGHLLVQVELATESWRTPDTDLQQTVTARFLADYAGLGGFADELEQVLDGGLEKAVLRSTKT
jgi:hypothetical protein